MNGRSEDHGQLSLLDHVEPDLCAHRHRGAETSREAFASMPPGARRLQREQVFRHVFSAGELGATTEEVSDALGLPYTSASARMSELLKEARVYWAGKTRPTRTGSSARVLLASRQPEELRPECLN